MRHLIDITDLSVDEIESILDLADKMKANPAAYRDTMHGRILATLFFEPSTRTRLSFESAMLSLGGSVLGFSSADSTSTSKRETLTDLLTIRTARGELGHVTIGMCGDLKFGRTVHSLIGAMSRYPGVEFVLISPPELRVPAYITQKLADDGIPFREVETMEEVMPELDVLYMTRVQKERFFNEADYIRLKDTYILDPDKLKTAKPDMAILHPLPRVNEISTKVDADPRAMYFEQVRNGRFVRMALISTLLEGLYED